MLKLTPLAGSLVCGLLMHSPLVAAEEITFRDLVRKFVQTPEGTVSAAQVPGLPQGVEKIVALEYTVLLRTPNGDEPVDANVHRFKIGDQVRVRVKPLNGLYIYIFHEGASGKRVCLLPEQRERPPLALPEKSLELPTDGSVFEFTPPAGDEKLIVVALEKPSDNLAALSDSIFKKPEVTLTDDEKRLRDEVKAHGEQTLKSILDRQSQGTRYRGMFDDLASTQIKQDVRQRGTDRVLLEEPPHAKQPSTFSMVALLRGGNKGELFVTIPLKSTPK